MGMCLPFVIWPAFYVDLTNHGLRQSVPSNPVDPIQPQNGEMSKSSLNYNTRLRWVVRRSPR